MPASAPPAKTASTMPASQHDIITNSTPGKGRHKCTTSSGGTGDVHTKHTRRNLWQRSIVNKRNQPKAAPRQIVPPCATAAQKHRIAPGPRAPNRERGRETERRHSTYLRHQQQETRTLYYTYSAKTNMHRVRTWRGTAIQLGANRERKETTSRKKNAASSCLSGTPHDVAAEDDLEGAERHRYPGVGDHVGAAREAGADGVGQPVLVHLSCVRAHVVWEEGNRTGGVAGGGAVLCLAFRRYGGGASRRLFID